MKSSRSLRLLTVGALAAWLVACGGGGGSSTTSTTPTAPTAPTNTGLSAPGLTLTQDISAAVPLVEEMLLTYSLAADAQAAKALGALIPGVGATATSPVTCSGGGSIAFATRAGSDILDYTYAACSDGTFTFDGTAAVGPTFGTGGAVTSYEIIFSGMTAAGPGGLNATLGNGTLTCTPNAGAAPSCVTTLGGYVWGYDVAYSNGLANGSHQCDCGLGSWNVTFKDFGATSGKAEVFATNGSAVVTRTGAKTFTVVMFVGSDVKTYDVKLP
jgi:hypothetical protein